MEFSGCCSVKLVALVVNIYVIALNPRSLQKSLVVCIEEANYLFDLWGGKKTKNKLWVNGTEQTINFGYILLVIYNIHLQLAASY